MSQKIFIQLLRNGDVLNILPILKAEADAGRRAALMTCPEFAPILDGVSYADRIIFDGNPHELDKAIIQAKQLSDDVTVLQLAGPLEVLKGNVLTRNGKEYATVHDSFLKDQYNIADAMDLWRQQPPLVIDKRDPEREKALKFQIPKKAKGKRLILVGVRGVSSPFAYKDLLMLALRDRFKRGWHILDLEDFKGERIYDLLALYEMATVLVAVDTAHLHLAQACPDLPVCALTNDSPSMWHGSAWRASHVFYCRYSDFPKRFGAMLTTIEKCAHGNPSKVEGSVVHVWCGYELEGESGERSMRARETWPLIFNSREIQPGMFGSDSKTRLKDSKSFPYVKDVIRVAARLVDDDGVIVLSRSDTCMKQGIHRVVAEKRFGYCHRRCEDGTWTPMVDLFVFPKRWWIEHQEEFPQMVMGNDVYWQQCLFQLLKAHGAVDLGDFVWREEVEPVKLSEVPPRVAHNDEVYGEFKRRMGPLVIHPSIHEQLPGIPVNRRALFPFGYNPSIVRFNNQLLMSYRWHRNGTPATELAIAELKNDGGVISNKGLAGVTGTSLEDARLFLMDGSLWMAYVESTWPDKPCSVVKLARLEESRDAWKAVQVIHPKIPGNDFSEMVKNLVPITAANGIVRLLFKSGPEQVMFGVDMNGDVVSRMVGPGLSWSYGQIKGGCTPMPYCDGAVIRFFHSTLDNEIGPWGRRYFIGAAITESEPPYKMVAMSDSPVLFGSELDDLTEIQRSACGHAKPKVVFPCGAIPWGEGEWLLSVGVNDMGCSLVRVTERDLKIS